MLADKSRIFHGRIATTNDVDYFIAVKETIASSAGRNTFSGGAAPGPAFYKIFQSGSCLALLAFFQKTATRSLHYPSALYLPAFVSRA